MAKRYMPSLDELDNGATPTLGIRERAELEEVRAHDDEDDDLLYAPDFGPTVVDDLFDPYE